VLGLCLLERLLKPKCADRQEREKCMGKMDFFFLKAEILSCVIFSTTAWFTVFGVVSSFSIERLVLMSTVRLEVSP
jgi:hypothetical protein